jgi:hypothetical protein
MYNNIEVYPETAWPLPTSGEINIPLKDIITTTVSNCGSFVLSATYNGATPNLEC